MSQLLVSVVSNERVLPSTYALTLDVGAAARDAVPGQVLLLRCGRSTDPFLRRPMGVGKTEGDTIEIMVQRAGAGSEWLIRLRPGDEIDCVGPVGRGFTLDASTQNLLLLGRGYGIGPLLGVAEKAVAQQKSVTLAVQAATADEVLPPRLLHPLIDYLVATDDGSVGYHGSIMDRVGELLPWADGICGSGPLLLMSGLASAIAARIPKKRAQIMIERRIACTSGVCFSCVVDTRRGLRRTCVDGPVFDSAAILWTERAA
ncbi:MAG: hypothetical protein EXR58_04600 [Chloroflexi bacterium]|nr:hypothetical protein [Chloroflexota bacterium]